jgi:uncharacterized protein YndB with AHSA1/START domain
VKKISRVIAAPRSRVFAAWMSKDAVAEWLPPSGMKAEIDRFDPAQGGGYRLTLAYQADSGGRGKTTPNTDVVNVKFVDVVRDERMVQEATFDTKDAQFAGTMTMTWTFEDADGGTRVTVDVANAPKGISDEDHEKGIRSTLDNLATYVAR